jgi:cytochrome c biogenesis protein CcdA/glutaredoxin
MKRIFKTSLIIIALLAGLLNPLDSQAQQMQIFQTNSANGHLFPCRCPHEPKGGLAKQAALVKKLTEGQKYWLLESGDIFGINTDRPSDSLVLAAIQAMKYQAVGVGDQELSKGGDYFLQLKGRFEIPFVSANLLYHEKPLVLPFKIVSFGNPPVKAALIGLISPKTIAYYPPEKIEGIRILPPQEVLRDLLDSLKNKADFFILLSHLGYEEEIDLAKSFPELSLIIGGHSQTELNEPDRSGGVPIIESGSGGKRLTRAVLARENGKWILTESKLFGVTSDLTDDPVVGKIIGPMPDYTHHITSDTSGIPAIQKYVIHIFVAPDCPDCQQMEKGLFRQIARKYSNKLKLQYHQVDDSREYRLLLDYERMLNDRNNEIPTVVVGNRILGGVTEIEKELEALISLQLGDKKSEKSKKQKSGNSALPQKNEISEEPKDSIYLAFVTNLRCQKCGRAEYMLKALCQANPRLVVRKFDLQSKEGKVIAEALGMLYNIPEEQRMIAPSAFVGNDYLVDKQIDDTSLTELISKYSNGTSRIPWQDAQRYITKAGESIFQRFKSFGVLGVAGAGLLDGINPCSLAVLVFFISYLAFVGRKRWEILAVGISYTLADFLVYFLIGIGGLSFLMTLKSLPILSLILYWLAVIAGLVLAFYNFKDYLKARKGDLSGMDLQLSSKTKQRIHKVIRERMGAGSLIGGAFLVGLVTSVLEFACTGQVYLPTIAFVSQLSAARYQAYGYLLLYNLMFEVPMIVTFIIAFWGVSSKTIAGWAQRSVAGVKMMTALLFLAMSAALLVILIK